MQTGQSVIGDLGGSARQGVERVRTALALQSQKLRREGQHSDFDNVIKRDAIQRGYNIFSENLCHIGGHHGSSAGRCEQEQ